MNGLRHGERVAIALATLVPVLAMAWLCWRVSESALTDIAMTAARSSVAQSERYFDRVARYLEQTGMPKDLKCDPGVVGVLDRAAVDALVVRTVGLYDRRARLFCSNRGPDDLDLAQIREHRTMRGGVEVVRAGPPLSPTPALAVDLPTPNGGAIATVDAELFAEMAPPFVLADEGALTFSLPDGSTLFHAGWNLPKGAEAGLQVTAISSRYGFTAVVQVPPEMERRRFFRHLVSFEAVGVTVSALLAWLLAAALRGWQSPVRALKTALHEGQLEVHYQPVLDLRQGRCVGAEALLRWRHPQRGLIRPDLFIPTAEESGLILPITEWLMRRVREDFDSFSVPKDFHVAINLVPRHLADGKIVRDVASIFVGSTMSPVNVVLEITERHPIGPGGGGVIEALRTTGAAVAVDDFGTGHSGLSYLQTYRFDFLKIDQFFVRAIGTDAVNLALVDTIIKLAHDLGIAIIAEGIETEPQLAYLTERGVQFGQGWLFAKALPAEEFRRFLEGSAPL